MPRVKRGTTHVKRRRSILKSVKGYRWKRKNTLKLAKTAILKAGVQSYVNRRKKKRDARRHWQVIINAALMEKDISYSKFIGAIKKKGIALDREILADLAEHNPAIWEKIVALGK